MGEDAVVFLISLEFPLADSVEYKPGELQRFTATAQVLVVPDIDGSLDEAPAKTQFWNAFKPLGQWWAELPPYQLFSRRSRSTTRSTLGCGTRRRGGTSGS